MNGESLILFFVIAVILVGGGIVFASIVAPRSSNSQKFEPYECGIPTEGPTWIQFGVGYYLFAIIYLVFDVETVFLLSSFSNNLSEPRYKIDRCFTLPFTLAA